MAQYRAIKLFDKNKSDLDEQVNEILERRKRELAEASAEEADDFGDEADFEDELEADVSFNDEAVSETED